MRSRKGGYRSLPRDHSALNIRGLCKKFKCLSSRPSSVMVDDNESCETGHPTNGLDAALCTSKLAPSKPRKSLLAQRNTNFLETTMDMTGIETSIEHEHVEEEEQGFFTERRRRRQTNLIGSVLVIDKKDECAVEQELGDPLVYTYSADSTSGTDQEVEVIMQGNKYYGEGVALPTFLPLHEQVGRNKSTMASSSSPEELSQPFPPYRFGLEQVYFREQANTWQSKHQAKKLNHRHQSDASTSATHTTASNSSVSVIRSTVGSSSNHTMQSLSSAAYDRLMSQQTATSDGSRQQVDGFYLWDS